jgi:alpha-mannosidase
MEMGQWPVFPKIRFGTFHEFFKIAETMRDKLPVIKEEANHIFTGCYTTQSRIKLGNRKGEAALLDAEGFNAVSFLLTGYAYPNEKLRGAWQNLLFTHFHDILTGSCVRDTRDHAMGLYAGIIATANTARENATRAISNLIDTSMIAVDTDIADTLSEGAGVGYGIENYSGVPNPETGKGKTRIYTIFNPSPRERTEMVELTVWDWPGDKRRIEVTDHAGGKIPFQMVDINETRYWDHFYFRILVQSTVPALGYMTVVLKEAELTGEYPFYYQPSDRVGQKHLPIILENEYLKAVFSPENGALLSLTDKGTGLEQIKNATGGQLVLCHTESASGSAWTIGRTLGKEPVNKTLRLKPLPAGDLRNGFEMEQEIASSTVKTTVTLDKTSMALSYRFYIKWHEYAVKGQNVPVLVYALPLAHTPIAYQTDVAAGHIRRPSLHDDVPGLQYMAAVGAHERAVALVSDSKYGYRGCGDILHLTLINTSDNPDLYPELGEHTINMWVAVDSACPKALQENAANFCRPMNYLSVGAKKGELKPVGSFLKLDAQTTVLSSVGLTENGSLLVRMYETCGKDDTVSLKLPFTVTSAQLVDLDGNVLGEAAVNGQQVSFPLKANCIAGVKINGI